MSREPSAISVDETAVMTAVGAAIVARRTELKISQQALARTVGTSRTFLRGIEAGERAPTVITLTRIARALHTTPSALITTRRINSSESSRAGRRRKYPTLFIVLPACRTTFVAATSAPPVPPTGSYTLIPSAGEPMPVVHQYFPLASGPPELG